jgi:hypothetical protein
MTSEDALKNLELETDLPPCIVTEEDIEESRRILSLIHGYHAEPIVVFNSATDKPYL